MKNMLTRTLTALTLVVMGLAMTAQAEYVPTIKTTVPFEFTFGDQTFPAGDYLVTQPQQNLLMLRDSRGRGLTLALIQGIESLNPSAATELKFLAVGDQHILVEVWQENETFGARLYPAKSLNKIAMHRSPEAHETAEGSRP